MKKNIILIVVDALRADFLKEETMPYVSSLADKGMNFTRVYTTTNASDPALTSLMTGCYPHNNGIIHHSFEVSKEEIKNIGHIKMLQEILKENGYATYGLDWLGRWHKRGFDYYMPRNESGRKKQVFYWANRCIPFFKTLLYPKLIRPMIGGMEKHPNDEERVAKVIEILKGNNKSEMPFFILLHFWSVHKPRKAAYIDCVREVDKLISQIEILKDTIVVITSDHGESLGENGIMEDHHGLFECTIRVPLIIYGIDKGKDIRLHSTIDIMPLVLYHAGLRCSLRFDGQIDGHHSVKVYENWYQDGEAIILDDYKYISTRTRCRKCNVWHGKERQLFRMPDETPIDDKFIEKDLAEAMKE